MPARFQDETEYHISMPGSSLGLAGALIISQYSPLKALRFVSQVARLLLANTVGVP